MIHRNRLAHYASVARRIPREERRKLTPEAVARAFSVPPWVVLDTPKPSWFRRPIVRLRAWWWAR